MTAGREVAVRSRTTPGVAYRVLIGIDGELSCTCAGFEFRGQCWHIDHVEKNEMTNEEHALVPIKVTPPQSILPSMDQLSVIGTLAKSVIGARGHAVPKDIDSPAKAAAVMLAGFELGVPPMTALRHVMVIGGKTEPDAQLMAGIVLARETDARLEVVELTDEKCTMRFLRPSRGITAEYTYTLADAKKAGLIRDQSNWSKFPRDMMRWAATKRLCRAYAPDLINSVSNTSVEDAGALIEAVAAPAPVREIDVAQLPREALYSEGDEPEVPANVNTKTGEILDEEPAEGEFTEEPAEDERQSAPVAAADLEAASEFVRLVAEENSTTYEGVLDTWNADIFGVAADLDGYRQRYEQRKARRGAKANAGAAS